MTSPAPDRPPYTGGAVQLSSTPHAFARRILDGLRRQLGRPLTGDDIRGAMALLEATRASLPARRKPQSR